jgi:tetratricopeptide (TPR) repeat protein
MKWWHVGLIVLACGIVYSNTLENAFHLDDAYRVEDNPGVQRFWPPWRHFTDETTSSHLPRLVQYRPLLPLTLSINYAIAGDSLVGYHLGNLLFQIVASLLVYFLARELLVHWCASTSSPLAPLFVGLLFAVHPVSGILVNYICSRDLLMMQMFLVGALLSYARMRRLGDTAFRWTTCSLLLLGALLAKKNAVVFPALVGLFELLFTRGSLTRLARVLVPAGIVGTFLLFVRFGLGFSDAGNIIPDSSEPLVYASHQLQHHVFHYLRNFAWPFPIRQSAVDTIETWKIVTGGICLVGSWGLAAYWWRRAPLLAFCVLGYQVLIALTSSFLPLFDGLVAYRPYPSSMFLFLGGVFLLRRAPGLPVLLAAAVVYFGAASLWLNTTWKDERSLWAQSVSNGAGTIGHYNMAQALPDTDPAKRRHFESALENNEGYVVGQIGYALLMIRTGDHDAGIARLQLAVRLEPRRAQTHYWLAQALEFLKRSARAADAAAKASALQPGNLRYRYYAAQRASAVGRFAEVVRLLEATHLRHGPFEHSGILIGMSSYKIQDWPKAIRYLEEFLARNPSFTECHETLARCYRATGDIAAAARHQRLYDSRVAK